MEDFIKELSFTKGKYREIDIFTDLIKLTSYFIQVNMLAQAKYEKNYKEILNKYNQYEQKQMTILIIKLCELFDKQEYPSDILGKIFHSINANNKQLGQFFTPQHLQELCSALIGINKDEMQEKGYITINEPSCGSGRNDNCLC